jgi:hypothetical protein
MRNLLIALAILLGAATPASASNVSVSIGINVPVYPELVPIPRYPVYYAPRLHANYFFYDGLYWVFDGRTWCASSWYNGPWYVVDRYEVPVYLLHVPVRYYREPPMTFRRWQADAPPRWDVYWGETWSQRRSGWTQLDIAAAPAPAPLPLYQREYTGDRYPQLAEQVTILSRNYRYEPRDAAAKVRFQQLRAQAPRVERARGERVRVDQARVGQARVEQARARQARGESARNRIEPARTARVGPPAHAQAKGWPGKGHERALSGERPAPPAHAQAKGWPGKGHERALDRQRDEGDGHPGKGKGRGHER